MTLEEETIVADLVSAVREALSVIRMHNNCRVKYENWDDEYVKHPEIVMMLDAVSAGEKLLERAR